MRAWSLLSLAGVCCCSVFLTSARASAHTRHVVVISIDGLMPRTYASAGWNVPTLRRLASRGVFAEGVVGVFPSVTYPSHTTLITGVTPAQHGIYANRLLDPASQAEGAWYWNSRDIHTVTLPGAATTGHWRTAMINWPVSVGTRAAVLLPDLATVNEPGRVTSSRSLATPATLLHQVDAAIHRGLTWPVSDSDRSAIAAWVIREDLSDLLLLHLDEVDAAQHEFGPDSEAAHRAVERADGEVATILHALLHSGLDRQTDIVIVSDHGCAPVWNELNPNAAFRQNGWLRLDDAGQVTDWTVYFQSSGGSGFVYLKDSDDGDLRERVDHVLHTLSADPRTGISRVLDRGDLRALGADPRPAFAIEMAPGFTSGEGVSELVRPASVRGSHGYPPTNPAMYASLIMAGPDVRARGSLGVIRMTAVAPTVASWLHVRLAAQADDPLRITTANHALSARK
jgi:predicted AlkP superfamily pyrophosphatase or phosphodiesterase